MAVAADHAGESALFSSERTTDVTLWPGGASARTIDEPAYYGTDVSGLVHQAGSTPSADRLWAVDDGDGRVLKLQERSGVWVRSTDAGWGAGKQVKFPDGRTPDAEGLVVVGGAAYLSTERDGSDAARPSIIRMDLAAAGPVVTASHEWRLRSEFPDVSPNLGLEGVTFVPDDFLVARGFVDESSSAPYDPARYPQRVEPGVFFTAAEAPSEKGVLHGYVLNEDGSFVRVARVDNPLALVTDLEFEADSGRLWASCDDYCQGRSATFEVSTAGATRGRFVATASYARPSGLPDHNNEGFAIAPHSRCVAGIKPVYWSNDSNDGSHALWSGTVRCESPAPLPVPEPPTVPEPSVEPEPEPEPTVEPTPEPTVEPEPTPEPSPTQKPVDLGPSATTVVARAQRVSAGGAARIKVEVTADRGAVAGTVTVTSSARTATAPVVGGRATVNLGRFTKTGLRRLKVSYAGSGAPSSTKTTLRVVKARSTLTPVKKKVSVKRKARARLVTRFRANGLKPTGKVKVKVGKRVVSAKVRRTGSRIIVRTPRLRSRGTVKVTVIYAGNKSTRADRTVFRVRVR